MYPFWIIHNPVRGPLFHITDWGTNLPLPILFLSIFLLLIFSWWSYSGIHSLPTGWRWTLALLRWLSLSLLYLLLAGFWIEKSRLDGDRSTVPIYLDDSESIRAERPGWMGVSAIREAVTLIERELEQRQIPYERHLFAGSVSTPDPDSLWRSATRFDPLFEHLRDPSTSPPAALILSDGLDTEQELDEVEIPGSLPPLFSVSLGSSQTVPDLVLEEILLPNPLDLHQRNRLWFRATRSRMDAPSATVELRIDGELRERMSIQFSDDRSTVQSIALSLPDTGRVRVDLAIIPQQEEWSTDNNHWSGERMVQDRRTTIWHLATSIHPDIRWVREQLQTDRHLRIDTANLFDETGDLPESSPDLIILHGDPHSGPWPDRLTRTLNESGVFWMVGQNGLPLPEESDGVQPPSEPLTMGHSPWIRTLASIVTEDRDHPLVEPFRAWLDDAVTPLWIHSDEWQPAVATETIRMQGSIPFLFLQEVGDRRRTLMTATGWYLLSHSDREREEEIARELFSSIFQWTANREADMESEETVESSDGTEWTQRIRELHPSARNDSFLQRISSETGGAWRTMDPSEPSNEWLNALEERVDRERETRVRVSLHSSPVWYVLLLFLLATEWILRRRFRMM